MRKMAHSIFLPISTRYKMEMKPYGSSTVFIGKIGPKRTGVD